MVYFHYLHDRRRIKMQKMVLLPYDRYERLKQFNLEPICNTKEPIAKSLELQDETPDKQPDNTAFEGLTIDDILEAIPKNVRTNAKALLEHLRKRSDLIWNERGEISVGGHTVLGSNIVDLVKVSLKDYKDFKPVGLETFTKAVHESNAPLSLLTASKRQFGAGLPPPPGVPVKRKGEKRKITKFKWLKL